MGMKLKTILNLKNNCSRENKDEIEKTP